MIAQLRVFHGIRPQSAQFFNFRALGLERTQAWPRRIDVAPTGPVGDAQSKKKEGFAASQTTRFMVFPIRSPYGYDLEKGARADLQGFEALPDI